MDRVKNAIGLCICTYVHLKVISKSNYTTLNVKIRHGFLIFAFIYVHVLCPSANFIQIISCFKVNFLLHTANVKSRQDGDIVKNYMYSACDCIRHW